LAASASAALRIVPAPTMASGTAARDGLDALQRHRRAQRHFQHAHATGHQGLRQRHGVLHALQHDDGMTGPWSASSRVFMGGSCGDVRFTSRSQPGDGALIRRC
jgi:hypothetical protein